MGAWSAATKVAVVGVCSAATSSVGLYISEIFQPRHVFTVLAVTGSVGAVLGSKIVTG